MWSHAADIILVSLVGGLLSLDRTVAFQIMICRPITAGFIIGLILGQPVTGLVMGAMIELVWINNLPLGGQLPPNECLAAIIVTAAVVITRPAAGAPPPEYLTLGFLFAPPWARLAAHISVTFRRFNSWLARAAVGAASGNQAHRVYFYHLTGVGMTFLRSAAFIFISLMLTIFLINSLYPLLTPWARTALGWLYYAIPLIGVASALSSMHVKGSWHAFAVVYTLSLSVWGLFLAL